MVELKVPEPVPLFIVVLDVVGLAVKLQQTPLCVIGHPPSSGIFPPAIIQ